MKNHNHLLVSLILLKTIFFLPSCTSTQNCFTESDVTRETKNSDKTIETLFTREEIVFNTSWEFADYTKINSGSSFLYTPLKNKNGKTIALNAGHGTEGGTKVKTLCHPDGSPKNVSGSTLKGSKEAHAVSLGIIMNDGKTEAEANLTLAKILLPKLLSKGYSVLMIRDEDDVQLDNIARTVIANNNADVHIALHYDSSESDKGIFFCSIPDIDEYKAMYPVSENWLLHKKLGECIIDSAASLGLKISGNGKYPIDLTQTSYSTIPSIDLEVGDRISDRSDATLEKISSAIVRGLDDFFSKI